MTRRSFVELLALTCGALRFTFAESAAFANSEHRGSRRPQPRVLFTSLGRTGIMNADGRSIRYFDFKVPDQVTWQPGPDFTNGKRIVFLSMEERRDGPGRPFDEYYTLTPTHLWVYDFQSKALKEVAAKERLAPFYTPALLLNDERILVQVVRDRVGQIFSMNLDGTDAKEFTKRGEGLPYGLSLSPDRRRIAFHLAGRRGYEIWTSDLEGGSRRLIAGHPDHLYFGTSWSPDGNWILYQDCLFKQDPGHDWSDICVASPDGKSQKTLTQGQSHWFGAAYGNPKNRGSGSNMPAWTPAGEILFANKLPESKVPWEYRTGMPDTDHFNREFKPESARGGTHVCSLNPIEGTVKELTSKRPDIWDFRPTASPDGRLVVFCRAATGRTPEIWRMDADGRNARLLTRGIDGRGADHPRWIVV